MRTLKDDNRCFACGKDNPIGLKLEFENQENSAVASVVFSKNFEGWEGVVHGGLLSTILDEVMVKSARMNGYRCVTAELNVKYKRPCLSGCDYVLRGKVVDTRKNIVFTESEIVNGEGEIIAVGSGKLFIMGDDSIRKK